MRIRPDASAAETKICSVPLNFVGDAGRLPHTKSLFKNLNQLRKRERGDTHGDKYSQFCCQRGVQRDDQQSTAHANNILSTDNRSLDSEKSREVERDARAAPSPCLSLVVLPSLVSLLPGWLSLRFT